MTPIPHPLLAFTGQSVAVRDIAPPSGYTTGPVLVKLSDSLKYALLAYSDGPAHTNLEWRPSRLVLPPTAPDGMTLAEYIARRFRLPDADQSNKVKKPPKNPPPLKGPDPGWFSVEDDPPAFDGEVDVQITADPDFPLKVTETRERADAVIMPDNAPVEFRAIMNGEYWKLSNVRYWRPSTLS